MQQEFEGLPLPLLVQLVAAVAACLLGCLVALGSFKPIRIADVPRQALSLALVSQHGVDCAAGGGCCSCSLASQLLRAARVLPRLALR